MNRPEIISVMQSSLNGKIALSADQGSRERRECGFSSAQDFLFLRRQVAHCDAVMLGWRTLATEFGAFRVADLRDDGIEPHWIVLSGSGQVDLGHGFWRQEGIPKSVCLCTSFLSGSPEAADLRILPLDFPAGEDLEISLVGGIDGVLDYLWEYGIRRIALLGGGEVNRFFWQAGLVDRFSVCFSPHMVLGANLPTLVADPDPLVPGAIISLSLSGVFAENGFVFAEYVVNR